MTTILGIDTSTTHVGVAIAVDDRLAAEVSTPAERRHAEMLVPAIADLLRGFGIAASALDAVAVGIGPGLFTGLRVGVTTAMTMAHALGRPVLPVPTLDVLAAPHAGDGRLVVPVIDAKRREVFSATYATDAGLRRRTEDAVGTPAALASELAALGVPALLVGDGALAHAATFSGLAGVELAGAEHAVPRAGTLVRLAGRMLDAGGGVEPSAVRPRYLRKSDAELNWEAAGR